MARAVERMTALAVTRQKKPGYHADGAGLYLQVSPTGTKSWVFRYKVAGRAREMGLGSLQAFSLAEARLRAKSARQLLADGVDPIERRTELTEAAAAATRKAANVLTFGKAADQYIEAHESSWKKREARIPVAADDRHVREARDGRPAGERDRHRARAAGAAAHLDDEDGDCNAAARPHGEGARLGEGAQAPHRR